MLTGVGNELQQYRILMACHLHVACELLGPHRGTQFTVLSHDRQFADEVARLRYYFTLNL